MKTFAGYLLGCIFMIVAMFYYVIQLIVINTGASSNGMYLIMANVMFALGLMLVVLTTLIERATNYIVSAIVNGQNKDETTKDKPTVSEK